MIVVREVAMAVVADPQFQVGIFELQPPWFFEKLNGQGPSVADPATHKQQIEHAPWFL